MRETLGRPRRRWVDSIVTVLVTLDACLDWRIDLLDIHQVELQLVVTQSYCNYNTS
jgi:hypothetical protein